MVGAEAMGIRQVARESEELRTCAHRVVDVFEHEQDGIAGTAEGVG